MCVIPGSPSILFYFMKIYLWPYSVFGTSGRPSYLLTHGISATVIQGRYHRPGLQMRALRRREVKCLARSLAASQGKSCDLNLAVWLRRQSF